MVEIDWNWLELCIKAYDYNVSTDNISRFVVQQTEKGMTKLITNKNHNLK